MSKNNKKTKKKLHIGVLEQPKKPLSDSILNRMKPKLWWGWSTGLKTGLKSTL